MKNIRSVADHELTWSQQSLLKSEYELRFGGELVATLRFPKMMGTLGVVESGDGSWTFERIGFWRSKTVVKVKGSIDELATYTNDVWKGGGSLELRSGKKFIAWRSIWKGSFELRTDEGEALYQIKQLTSFRVTASLRINRKALQLPEFPWMVLFGFYLFVMARSDAAAQAAVS